MNCKQAQTKIALWVGNDLDDNETATLDRHVAQCPECREYHARMIQVQQMFGLSDSQSSLDESIWPALEQKIDRQQKSFRREQFNGWVPAFAVAAACLLLLFFSRTFTNLQQPDSPVAFEAPSYTPHNTPDFVPVNWPIRSESSVGVPAEELSIFRDLNSPRSVENPFLKADRDTRIPAIPFSNHQLRW